MRKKKKMARLYQTNYGGNVPAISAQLHTEKYFRNLIKSNPNQSVHGKYNLISVEFDKNLKKNFPVRT